jgi:hypothetical protein
MGLLRDPQRSGGICHKTNDAAAGLLCDPQCYGGNCHSTTDASATLLSFSVFLQNVSEKLTFCRKTKNAPYGSIVCAVIQLGFEPRTPSLKGMCSTC